MKDPVRSFAAVGAVFLLGVSAVLVLAFLFVPEVGDLFAPTLVTAAVYLAVAYACWGLRRWGFIAAMILAPFTVLLTIVLFLAFGSWSVESVLWIVLQLTLILFSFRAYRELGTS